MWNNYKVSAKNEAAFEELCRKFRQSPDVFQDRRKPKPMDVMIKQEQSSKEGEENVKKKVKINGNDNSSVKAGTHDAGLNTPKPASSLTTASPETDLTKLQKRLICSLRTSEKVDTEVYRQVRPTAVCSSSDLVPSDEVLIQAFKNSEKFDDTFAEFLGMLLLLPKLCHLSSELSTPVVQVLVDFTEVHTSVMVTQVLVPLLQHCPTTRKQHKDALVHLLPRCSSEHATQMLSAFSMRESASDVDVHITHLLCEHADPQAPATHAAVLAFMSKTSDMYASDMKFGHCLLFVVKKMGQYIQDLDSLQSVVNKHSSSMKKAIEVQMKKVMRSR